MRRLVVVMAMAVSVTTAYSQRWQWPDKPKNLTVLPKTTTGRELQRTMLSFTNGLGVRCVFCHVGEEGKDLSEYDFVADSKPEKNTARTMIRMVNAINTEYLSGLRKDQAASIDVTCVTCHRGNALPIMLEDQLKKTFDSSGIDSTLRQYHALREQYYGGFVYNFKEGTLLRLAEKIMADTTRIPDAITILKLNIELYPSFAFSYIRLANIYEEQGNIPAAIENYEQAVKLDPRDERAKRMLERIQKK